MIDNKIREYLLPTKILKFENVKDSDVLLSYNTDQSYFGGDLGCVIEPNGYILFDFGKEYSGGIKIVSNDCSGHKNARVGITFGESAMEALSTVGEKDATNDHAIREEELTIPWVGHVEYGNTGFRFVKIQNKSGYNISLKQVFAVFVHCNAERKGSFRCSDEQLNKIWETGAYTIFLNIQDYVYDGIKRDRVVWIGDMHPETSSIIRLFGKDERVENSLEFVKRVTPHTEWMNGIPTYSMWWIKIVYDYYFYTGNKDFAKKHVGYVVKLAERLVSCVNTDGSFNIDFRFIDWPSSENPQAQESGVRALLYLALTSAKLLMDEFCPTENKTAEACIRAAKLLKVNSYKSNPNGNKQAGALLCFADIMDAKEMNESLLSKNELSGLSSFLGYYVLQARAKAGDMQGALNVIRNYWGAMLDLGATTFWEDFNIEWINGAKPIDSILSSDEYDVHGDNGAYCYKGFRHSLCHGWSAGVVPFMSEFVLGVKFVGIGCSKIEISPDLGNLDWVEGEVPTPYGVLKVSVKKTKKGLYVTHNSLENVEIILKIAS